MTRRLALAAALAVAAAPAFAAPATYKLDATHTQVVFGWNHLGFSNPVAQFGQLEGTLRFDPDAPTQSSVEVTIALDSVNSNVAKLDEHLRGAEYFDVAKHPVATFKSTKVTQGSAPDKLKVDGELSLHGVTRPIVLDVTINKVGPYPMRDAHAAGFDATATLKRSEFGIDKLVPMISDDIKIHITTEAIAAKPTQA